MEIRRSSGKVSIDLQDIYAIGFADGRRGDIRRGTFMLQRWELEELQCYNRGYNDGQQRLLEYQRSHSTLIAS